ncbi:MAG TPA: TolC family protein [Acidobacteria bacterium]|nr:TolC family protein [Acidobacteriota bacterium]
MTVMRSLRYRHLISIPLLALATTAGAQSSDDSLVGLATRAAARLAVIQIPGSGPRTDLTLEDAIARALERNLDIAVQRLNPLVVDLNLAQALSAYSPTFDTSLSTNSSTSPSSTQLDGGQRVVSDRKVVNTGITQAVAWGGGRYTVDFNNNRQASTNTFSSFNPSYRSSFQGSYTQPLLRGFKIDSTRQQIQVTRINRDIADIDLRQLLTNTVSSVQDAYWDLVYATGTLEVQRQALELAETLIRDNEARVEIGTMAPIEIVSARSEAAQRRQSLAQAEQNLATAELALKQLIVGGTDDEYWAATLNPVDLPTLEVPAIDLEEAIRTALDERTDIARSRRQLDINNVNLSSLSNSRLPAVDLVGTYQLQGQGGTRFNRTGLGGLVFQEIPGGIGDAFNQLYDVDFPTWNLQLTVSYPLGQSAADAQYARARIQVQQVQAQLRQLGLQVATEVTNAVLQIQGIARRIEASTAARELATEQLAAEQSKFAAGLQTNFFVVQAQRDLATAQDTELRAILDQQKALVEFDRVQRTSLSGAGISIVQ